MKKRKGFLDRLASVPLTLTSLGLGMVLIVIGTLAQTKLGTFEAQKEFFNSWWIYTRFNGVLVPIFPGGLSVGALWFINLLASFITRFHLTRKDLGIFLTHAGLILLLAGQFFTQLLARETHMPIEVGHSSNYSESPRAFELAVIKTSDPAWDEVTAIPESRFMRLGEIQAPRLPFSLIIHRVFQNSELGMSPTGTDSLANQGIGTRVSVRDLPPAYSDEEPNVVSAFVEVREGDQSRGIWLLSSGLGAPQTFTAGGSDYTFYIRPKRHYYPFTLTLKEFRHDIYPGTDIPKNFASLVRLSNPQKNDDREALIYMNHPLRYEGKTFYQASFGEGDKLSVFQVVENPAYVAPYVSCLIIILGLLIQFLSHLLTFVQRRA